MKFLDYCYSQHDFWSRGETIISPKNIFTKEPILKTRARKDFNALIDSLPDYLMLSKYRGANTRVIMVHLSCGTVWKVEPRAFKNQGTRCPRCAHKGISNLEKAVAKKLQEMNISYLREYRFSDCKDKHPLPFDFVLLDDKGNIFMALEVDGKQHEKPYEFFGGQKAFDTQKKHEAIKENYCRKHNIEFRRINRDDLNSLNI